MIERALTSNSIKESTKKVLRNYYESSKDVNSLVDNIMGSINKETGSLEDINVRIHFIINNKLCPGKEKQSLRAAISSSKTGDPIDKDDVEEILGYKVKWKSLDHLEFLLTQEMPDFSKYTDQQVVDYVRKELGGTPRIGKKRVSNFRKEGAEVFSRRIIDHIFKNK